MRPYVTDSPQAAARIVALTMLADGHVGHNELAVLQAGGADPVLDSAPGTLHQVLSELCEDLLQGCGPAWDGIAGVDADSLARLLGEIADPALRERVLALCLSVAEADDHVSDGEARLLTQAVEHWGLHARMFGGVAA